MSDTVCNIQDFPRELLSQSKQDSVSTAHRPTRKPDEKKEVRGGTEGISALSQPVVHIVIVVTILP